MHTPEDLISLLGMSECPWQTTNGAHGYRDRLWYDCISIHFNGRADMGVWLEMSGQGCRAFETYGTGDYNTLFKLVLDDSKLIHITRLDIAYDEYDYTLDIDKLCKHTLEDKWRSKMEFYEVIQSSNGKSLDIGSKSSDVMIRIYDKLAERLSKFRSESEKEKIRDEIPHWIRIEIQMRDERALEFIRQLEGNEIGNIYCGVLRNYLEYGYWRDLPDGSRKFSTFAYWEKLLNGAEARSIYVKPGTDYNLARCCDYVYNQAGNAVDALLHIYGPDLFQKLLEKRTIQPNPKYLNLISKHKKGCLKS